MTLEAVPATSKSPAAISRIQIKSMSDVEERVIRVIAETQQIDPNNITRCSTFTELDIDSFDGINVLFAIESEFDISVPDDDAKQLRGIADVIDGVEKLLAAKQATPES